MTNKTLKKILYAEDDPDIQEVAELAMETIGEFTVETCSSGLEVMDKALQFEPELFLLDVMMPGLDGPGVVDRLRETQIFKSTPIVFMTAKVMEEEIRRYQDLGVAEIIKKPFDPAALSQQLLDIWNRLQTESVC